VQLEIAVDKLWITFAYPGEFVTLNHLIWSTDKGVENRLNGTSREYRDGVAVLG
jgi:hypothetical protein